MLRVEGMLFADQTDRRPLTADHVFSLTKFLFSRAWSFLLKLVTPSHVQEPV
jgi:hypothetical protein